MTRAQPRPGGARTDAVSTASGQIAGPAGLVTPARSGAVVHQVVPAHLACRLGARARAGGTQCLARGGLDRAGVVRPGVLRGDPGRAAREHQRAPGRLDRDRRADGGRAGRRRRGRRAAADVALGPAGTVHGAGRPERAGPGLRRDRLSRAGYRGDARGPGGAGRVRGRVLGVRGRGRDHAGQRAGPGYRGGGGQLRDLHRDGG